MELGGAQAINTALGELLDSHPGMCVFGEDVGRKGGVYGVTKGLQRRFGPAKVFDTLLDEQSILGVAIGYRGAIARVTSEDSFIPLGPAANTVLLDEAAIEKAAIEVSQSG